MERLSAYAFIGAAPFIFVNQIGRPTREVGFYLALDIVCVWVGNVISIRMVSWVGTGRLMVFGNALSCAGAAIFFAAVVSGHLSVVLTVLPLAILTFGAGIASPNAMAKALSVDPSVAGSSSGLYGFTQIAIGAGCTALAAIGSDPALAAASVLLTAGILAQPSF